MTGNRTAGCDTGIKTNTDTGRHPQSVNGAGKRNETQRRILRVNTEFDGVTMHGRRAAVFQTGNLANPRAFGNRKLRRDQIDACHRLRNRMFHLNTRVNLHERHGAVRINEKLHRSGTLVARLLTDGDGRRFKPPRDLIRQERSRRLLDKLLIATLQRTVTCADCDNAAGSVAQHLHLHMTGTCQKTFDEAIPVAERKLGLMRGRHERLAHIFQPVHDLQASPAAAIHGFDGQRKAMSLSECHDLGRIAYGLGGARGHRCAHFGRDTPGFDFGAEHADGVGSRPDPYHAGGGHRFGKVRVFGKKPVAGMYGVGMRFFGGLYNRVNVEIRAFRIRPMQRIDLVGQVYEQRVGIRIGVSCNGRTTGVMARVDDAHRDLAAVGDQDSLQSGHYRASLCSCDCVFCLSDSGESDIRKRILAPGGSCPARISDSDVSTAMTG